ncbi:MAG TPA: sugar-binding domain-containing protein, partial [Tissierellaceae bacterium]|nr:sugar-binding domain-containing protein [Tissierellaceae bacterium]
MSRYTDKEMVKAAHYYYKQDLTQSQIAKRMGMSRQRVNRILKKAVEENIVQITIVDVDKYNVELESKLEERFNLKEAVVVSVQEEGEVIPSLGQAGAEYLERILQKDDIMGVTWGRTLSEVAKRLPLNENLKVSVVQLIGGMNIAFTDLKADEITREMARKLGGE